jgi:hypothetical protein
MKQTLEKAFYLVLLLVTLYIQFGMAQDTLGMKYLNTRPLEQLKLQDGRILVIMDDLWKNTQIVKFNNQETYYLRKKSIGLPVLFELPDTVNAWVVTIGFKKYEGPVIPPPVDEIIELDNVGAHSVYTGAWTHAANNPWNANHFNKTISYTFAVNATVVVSFTGKKVELYSEKRVNHGIAAVSIDNGPEVMIDQYANDQTNNTQKLFEQSLTPGNHTIKLRMTGTKNPAASEANIMFDYIRVTK